ncbi:response regulator transcription factor [Granulicella cerasi]|nr:response regulator transcription factor [Granulicella cerasi]
MNQRIGILASDPLRSIGLESILNEIDGLEAVILSPAHLWKQLATLSALVLDTRMSNGQLPEMLSRIRRESPQSKVVVVGASVEPLHVQAVIGAGAKGYLAETASESEFRMAMEVVLDGSVWAPRKVLARLLEEGGTSSSKTATGLSVASKMTPREHEVLRLLKDGKSNRDIAQALGIDETTVKAHLGRMLRKTGTANRVELTLRAMEEEERA